MQQVSFGPSAACRSRGRKIQVRSQRITVSRANLIQWRARKMHKPIKYVEKAVTYGAKGVWAIFERMNRVSPNPSPTPKWSDKPLLKSYEKSKPPLGWPRAT